MNLPPYKRFPNIIGDKITLRQIQTADVNDIIAISYYDAVQATTMEQAMEMQAKINRDYLDGNSIHWGIADNVTNIIMGTCGYYRGLAEGAGELGCVLLPQYQRQGIMTASMSLAIDFGINNIGLKRVFAITGQENEKAQKLLERLNFEKIADLADDEIEYEFRQG